MMPLLLLFSASCRSRWARPFSSSPSLFYVSASQSPGQVWNKGIFMGMAFGQLRYLCERVNGTQPIATRAPVIYHTYIPHPSPRPAMPLQLHRSNEGGPREFL